MNKTELARVIRLGFKTVGEVGQYLHLMKSNHTELQVLSYLKFTYK